MSEQGEKLKAALDDFLAGKQLDAAKLAELAEEPEQGGKIPLRPGKMRNVAIDPDATADPSAYIMQIMHGVAILIAALAEAAEANLGRSAYEGYVEAAMEAVTKIRNENRVNTHLMTAIRMIMSSPEGANVAHVATLMIAAWILDQELGKASFESGEKPLWGPGSGDDE